jgi:REP element-mobilizing transposase RayT
MVAGYHLIWTAYGWWLPNDPRGSMSHVLRSATIAGLGELHRGRKVIQPAGRRIRGFYDAAREALKHPLLELTALEIAVVGEAFGEVARQRNYTCYGCAIMPDHVHLLIRKHRDQAEAMIVHFQESSRKALLAKPQAGRDAEHPVWGGPGWKVFLNTPEDMARVVKYIRDNPRKAGRAEQHWPFVQEYNGWLPGQVRVLRRAKPQAEG